MSDSETSQDDLLVQLHNFRESYKLTSFDNITDKINSETSGGKTKKTVKSNSTLTSQTKNSIVGTCTPNEKSASSSPVKSYSTIEFTKNGTNTFHNKENESRPTRKSQRKHLMRTIGRKLTDYLYLSPRQSRRLVERLKHYLISGGEILPEGEADEIVGYISQSRKKRNVETLYNGNEATVGPNSKPTGKNMFIPRDGYAPFTWTLNKSKRKAKRNYRNANPQRRQSLRLNPQTQPNLGLNLQANTSGLNEQVIDLTYDLELEREYLDAIENVATFDTFDFEKSNINDKSAAAEEKSIMEPSLTLSCHNEGGEFTQFPIPRVSSPILLRKKITEEDIWKEIESNHLQENSPTRVNNIDEEEINKMLTESLHRYGSNTLKSNHIDLTVPMPK